MNRRRMPRTAVLAAAVTMTMSACVFGGSDSDDSESPAGDEGSISGELEVVSFYPEGSPDYRRLSGLADEFEERHPDVSVTLVFGGGQDAPRIEARWRAGDPPEVNAGFFDTSLPDGGPYVESGQVLSLDEPMQQPVEGYEGSWEDAILPAVRPQITNDSDDTIYGVPESVTTLQFFYNEALFEENGLEAPTTFDELVSVADELKAAGVAPFTVTGTTLPYMQMYWDYLALRHIGVEGVQSALSGEAELASLPGAAEAAADLGRLTSGGYFIDGFAGTDFTSAQLSFFQGDAAMILMGSWLVGEMADAIPDGFRVGTFPFPSVEGGGGDQEAIFGTTNVQTVAAQSENPTAGVAWLRFIAEPENQEAYVEGTGSISAYAGIPAPEGFENVTAMLEEGSPFAPSYFGVTAQAQEVVTAYQEPIARLFLGQIDAETMLAEMSSGLQAAVG